MWNRLRFIRFLQVWQIFQRRKRDANKQDFENKFNLTCHAQSTPKTTGILTKVFSTSGPNLVALAWTGDELSRRQAQNGVNFDFEVKFDLEGQGQSPPKTIGILTKVFYIYGPNLVILAETGHELSRGQARDWRTDGRTHTQTDAGNDNTRRPILASGKNHNHKSVKATVSFLLDIRMLISNYVSGVAFINQFPCFHHWLVKGYKQINTQQRHLSYQYVTITVTPSDGYF